MYEGYRSGSRDGGGYRRAPAPAPAPSSAPTSTYNNHHHAHSHALSGSPPRRSDGQDAEYYRSRKDFPSPSRSLNYDDPDNGDAPDYANRWRSRAEPTDIPVPRDHDGGRTGGYSGSYGGGGHSGSYRDPMPARRPNGASGGKAIVLEDVPSDATERDILYGLDYITRDRHMSTDQVKLARLRFGNHGRRIAVVEFHRRSDAEYFMGQYYPEITFPLEYTRGIDSEPITVGIDFNKSRDDAEPSYDSRRDDVDWDCFQCGALNFSHRAVCFKCKAERPPDNYDTHGRDYGVSSGPLLTGESDECPQQLASHYLVVRDLEGSVTEEVLAKGVMKLFLDKSSEPAKEAPSSTNKLKSTAPTNSTAGLGARPGSLRRVFLMRDRKTNESWRYGFAEFETIEDARAAVMKFRAAARFTIASKPVFIAFIHTGVFSPPFDATPNENSKFFFAPIYNPALRLKYWDDRAYPSILVVSADPVSGPPSPQNTAGTGDATATDKSAANRLSSVKKAKKDKETAAATKITMMPQLQMWAKKSAEIHLLKPALTAEKLATKDKTESTTPAAIQRDLEELEADGPSKPYWTDQYTSYADWERVACLLCDWKVPSQQFIRDHGYSQLGREDILIDHEVRIHNHYKDPDAKEKALAKLTALGREPRSIIRRTPRLKSEALPTYQSYADFDTLHCHLCRRTFKHAQTIWRHEQESELHKRMLADSHNKERAFAELRAKGKTPVTMVPDSKSRRRQPQYRDRALERRQVFRQPDKPGAPRPAGKGTAAGEKRKQPAAAAEAEETPAKKSKGAGMLAKMGWTAGAGLGAEGTGRTAAIATEAYAPGVGLGAEGGKLGDASEEAARKTRGNFSDFVEKTRDKAKERYERLS